MVTSASSLLYLSFTFHFLEAAWSVIGSRQPRRSHHQRLASRRCLDSNHQSQSESQARITDLLRFCLLWGNRHVDGDEKEEGNEKERGDEKKRSDEEEKYDGEEKGHEEGECDERRISQGIEWDDLGPNWRTPRMCMCVWLSRAVVKIPSSALRPRA